MFSQNLLHQVVLKLALGSKDHSGPGYSERQKQFDHIVKDFDPAEKGKTSEEAHRASNKTQLSLSCHLHEKSHLRFCGASNALQCTNPKAGTVSFVTLTSLSISL